MKIVHFLQSIDNPSAGPTYSVSEMAFYTQAINDTQVTIFSLGNKPVVDIKPVPLSVFNGISVKCGLVPISALKFYFNEAGNNQAIFHQHGVWRSLNVLPLCVRSKAKLVWSPRGMFSEWSMSHRAYLKMPFWKLFQKRALDRVDCFHATSEQEALDIRRLGFKQPIALISNGVSVPQERSSSAMRTNSVVFLSRIHSKKGIHILLKAWKSIQELYPNWSLKIAGVLDSVYAIEMKALVENEKITNVEFVGGVFGADKSKFFDQARLFVLPSYSENFGIAIAEALAHSLPVITTVHTPWSELVSRKCGWYINVDEKELIDALDSALKLNVTELEGLGANGRQWMIDEYSWQKKALEMYGVYDWLLTGGEKPNCVILD